MFQKYFEIRMKFSETFQNIPLKGNFYKNMTSQPGKILYKGTLVIPKKCLTQCEPDEITVELPLGQEMPKQKCTSCEEEYFLDKFYQGRKKCVYCLSVAAKEKRRLKKEEALSNIVPNIVPNNRNPNIEVSNTEGEITCDVCKIYQKDIDKESEKNSKLKSDLKEFKNKIKELESELEIVKKDHIRIESENEVLLKELEIYDKYLSLEEQKSVKKELNSVRSNFQSSQLRRTPQLSDPY